MPRNNEVRRGSWAGHPDDNTNSTTASIATWSDTYADAERWVRWNGRRRWPDFAVNDAIWASSVTSWELHGRRAAA